MNKSSDIKEKSVTEILIMSYVEVNIKSIAGWPFMKPCNYVFNIVKNAIYFHMSIINNKNTSTETNVTSAKIQQNIHKQTVYF